MTVRNKGITSSTDSVAQAVRNPSTANRVGVPVVSLVMFIRRPLLTPPVKRVLTVSLAALLTNEIMAYISFGMRKQPKNIAS